MVYSDMKSYAGKHGWSLKPLFLNSLGTIGIMWWILMARRISRKDIFTKANSQSLANKEILLVVTLDVPCRFCKSPMMWFMTWWASVNHQASLPNNQRWSETDLRSVSTTGTKSRPWLTWAIWQTRSRERFWRCWKGTPNSRTQKINESGEFERVNGGLIANEKSNWEPLFHS